LAKYGPTDRGRHDALDSAHMDILGPILFVTLAILGGVYKFYWEPRGKSMLGRDVIDPFAGDPQAKALAPQVKQGNVRALGQLLASCGPNHDARGFYLRLLASDAPRPALDAWCAQEPQNAIAFLVRGRQSITWAWEARGSGNAKSVSEAAWRIFGERIELARRDLMYAASLDPRDATPWAELVRVAIAADSDETTARGYFTEAVRRDPTSYVAHREMLTYLSRRWHGDYPKMMAFARQVAASAPPGSDLPMLVVAAHLDEHNHRCLFDKNEADAVMYLHDPRVRAEILDAYHRTIGRPGSPQRHSTIYFRNDAAFAFFIQNDLPLLRNELMRLNGVFTRFPWGMQLASAADLVPTAKSRVGL
jgi:hypothetical protein